MSDRIVIEPVTRIEGHARVTIALDARGRARDARVELTALRGFEAICTGRPLLEMPALTSRICGVCPVAHSLAAAKAGDEILGADPPRTARMLRRLVLLGSLVQSHATSFFYFSAPDLVFGHDAPPERRNLFVLADAAPALARDGVLLRRVGQEIVEQVAGRRVHPAYAIPGGVTRPLEAATRDHLASALPAAVEAAERTLAWWSERLSGWRDEARLAELETTFLGHVGPGGELEHAEGTLRALSADGLVVDASIEAADCLRRIVERPVPWTYAKLCAWRDPAGHQRVYRVGPLARLNVATRCGTPRADRALREFRRLRDGAVLSTFHAHGARLIEILFGLESLAALLADREILSRDVLAAPGVRRGEGVGACEAPRGTLFHHYRVDEHDLVTAVNLVIPTGQNARAMNAAVRQVARNVLSGARITDALLNRVEAAVRAFDPCMSCATHTVTGRSVALRLVGPGGVLLDEWPREAVAGS